ncbi:activator of Hsp90 ATPase-like protein [Kribbella voronezhensis]|uniref:Activator of Hsp90 ATPase-like protein n=1 Tax=Kribbella voronezhensis TaxID=2512212 RepID=A0A4R7TGU4_9ACTN|nr:SRPBCC domain-containing protein [Kribbella voronezhensis]TDU91475.1 activator of Hsp90 ATPase-like protein [Kribbella voronezhensis]
MTTVVVPLPPEQAFELFTTGMATWWPLSTHSVGKHEATDVRFEGAVGGRIVEYGVQGPVGYWGTVSDWDPPLSVSFTWHPGSDPKRAGRVTARFRPVAAGTEVELTHTDWDAWDHVLDFYVRHSR